MYIQKFANGNVITSSRLKEKLRQKFKTQLIFHPSKASNKSDLVYADYITPGAVIESAIIPDDMSTTMDESSQDEGFNTDFLFKNIKRYSNENRELNYSAVYLKNLIMAVNTNR